MNVTPAAQNSHLDRTLVLVRHSKASFDAPTDIQRPLSARGRQMAEQLAKELSAVVPHPDLLWVSPAARARQTARALRARLEPACTQVEDGIYTAGTLELLKLLNQLVPEIHSVVVVGHEPTLSMLASMLHDRADALREQIAFGIPTATALRLTVPCPWQQLGARTAHLAQIITVPH